MAEGFEPSVAALTVRCLTSLATPQEIFRHEKAQKTHKLILSFVCLLVAVLAAATRLELVSSRLQDERSEAIELRRNLVDWEGLKPSREVCRTSMLSVTSPARTWWLWVELNHQPSAYETLALSV